MKTIEMLKTVRRMLCVWACGAMLVSGCAGSHKQVRQGSYGASARANYQKGLIELKAENYAEAARYFDFVKSRYPFSRYATLAELRLADSLYAEEKYEAAIDAYQNFMSLHPTHPQSLDGYAAYRMCLAHAKQMPNDWFLTPEGHERDQTPTMGAMREFQRFLQAYPDSVYLAKVTRLYRKSIHELVAHELYVARFYLERDKPKAAILRLEGILQSFPQASDDADVMLLLAKTYLQMHQPARARATLLALVKRYPSDANGQKAKLYLRYIDEK